MSAHIRHAMPVRRFRKGASVVRKEVCFHP